MGKHDWGGGSMAVDASRLLGGEYTVRTEDVEWTRRATGSSRIRGAACRQHRNPDSWGACRWPWR